jgi:hypothetical protein
MLIAPRCPECGADGIHYDPACIVWLCPRCDPDGKPFTISIEEAEPYAREHRARLEQLDSFVKRHYTPVPRAR